MWESRSGLLYSVNTLGSSAACFAAAFLLMRLLGEAGSVRFAVCFNLFVGLTALTLRTKHEAPPIQKREVVLPPPQETTPSMPPHDSHAVSSG